MFLAWEIERKCVLHLHYQAHHKHLSPGRFKLQRHDICCCRLVTQIMRVVGTMLTTLLDVFNLPTFANQKGTYYVHSTFDVSCKHISPDRFKLQRHHLAWQYRTVNRFHNSTRCIILVLLALGSKSKWLFVHIHKHAYPKFRQNTMGVIRLESAVQPN